jgi:hypothetical protein
VTIGCALEPVSWATQAVKSKQQTVPRSCTVYTTAQWSSGSHPCQPTRRTLAGRAIGSPADEGEGVACAGPCTHRQRLLEACDSGFELAASTRGEALYSRHLSREALRLHVAAGGSGSIQHALVHIAQFTQVSSVAAMPLGQLEQCKYV